MSAFHSKDGWLWSRLSDGSVEVKTGDGTTQVLDGETWASVVASVSARGDRREVWELARSLHDNIVGPICAHEDCPEPDHYIASATDADVAERT